MPEGHTLFAARPRPPRGLRRHDTAVTSPQGRFAEGAAAARRPPCSCAPPRQAPARRVRRRPLAARAPRADRQLHGRPARADRGGAGRRRGAAAAAHRRARRRPARADLVRGRDPREGRRRARPARPRPAAARRRPRRRVGAHLAKPTGRSPSCSWTSRCSPGSATSTASEVLFRHRLSTRSGPGRNLRRATWRPIWDDLERLMPLGVATGRIVTVEDQVLDVEAAAGPRRGTRLTERSSYVYKRAGMPCLVCGSTVRTRLVAGRNLFWCGRCQRRR